MPDLKEDVESVLEVIRNALRMEGGDIDLIDISEEGVVTVKLLGSCAGCPFSQMTLKNFVERELKSNVVGVKEVVAA
ncbi:MAG: NifU family protein [Euryarchaeota archaeon]|nr:NifU family protein [Euryarchaeota archaeon]